MDPLKQITFIGLITLLVIHEALAAESCYVHGDPHINTTDGKVYTFHGDVTCDYYLVRHNDFEIIGTFAACNRPHVSCLSKVQINYANNTWNLGPKGAVTDDVGNPENLPFTSDDIEIKESDKSIEASLDNDVRVDWDKKRRVTILIPVDYMNILTGMCGNFDGNPTNDFDPFPSTQSEEFGLSQKVSGSCVTSHSAAAMVAAAFK